MASLGDLQQALVLYVNYGYKPGSFTTAVLTNDLRGAFGNSDGESEMHLRSLLMWLYNEAPFSCWGTEKRVQEWMKAGGLEGQELPLLKEEKEL
jgi:hypothetical protein